MSIELKTVMGQLNIARGRWVGDAPNALGVREPTGRLRDSLPKGDLFVVVELRGDCDESEREKLSRALAEAIRNTYYQSSGSVTASLRRAMLAGNELLRAENKTSSGHGSTGRLAGAVGWVAGAAAAAVRGEDAFVATVGPAVAYTITRGMVTQFPGTSPWLDMADPLATGAPAPQGRVHGERKGDDGGQ